MWERSPARRGAGFPWPPGSRSFRTMPDGPLDHRYRGEHPVRTLLYLFREDRTQLLLGAGAFFVKHSPTWLTPVITAHVIDVVVERRPIIGMWLGAGLLLVMLVLNY